MNQYSDISIHLGMRWGVFGHEKIPCSVRLVGQEKENPNTSSAGRQ